MVLFNLCLLLLFMCLSLKNSEDIYQVPILLAVDGHRRCEKWIRNNVVDSKESKTTSWFKRFIGREQKPEVTWPFPFVEGRLFILTLRAGVDGYHINVGGEHVTSFAYRTVCWLIIRKSDVYALIAFQHLHQCI